MDVNILIALVDTGHIAHKTSRDWFKREGRSGWATCPLTENGLVRVLSHPKYPNGPGTPDAVIFLLEELTKLQGHIFWPDDGSLRDPRFVDKRGIRTSLDVTDSYLLALAASKGGNLASLDRRLSTNAVKSGVESFYLISGPKGPLARN